MTSSPKEKLQVGGAGPESQVTTHAHTHTHTDSMAQWCDLTCSNAEKGDSLTMDSGTANVNSVAHQRGTYREWYLAHAAMERW